MKALYQRVLVLALIFTSSITFAYSQKAKVIYQDPEFFSYEKGKCFDLVHHDYDISNKLLIARLAGLSLNKKKKTLDRVYESIVHKAKYIGANAFKIDTIIGARTDSIYFEVSIYQLTEAELDMNYDMF